MQNYTIKNFLLFSFLVVIIVLVILILLKFKTLESYSSYMSSKTPSSSPSFTPSNTPSLSCAYYLPTNPPDNTTKSSIMSNPFTLNNNQNIKFYYTYLTKTSKECADKCLASSNCGGYFYTGDQNFAQTGNPLSSKNCFLTSGSKNNGTLPLIDSNNNLSAIYCSKPSMTFCQNFCQKVYQNSNTSQDDVGTGTPQTGQVCCCSAGGCCAVDNQGTCR